MPVKTRAAMYGIDYRALTRSQVRSVCKKAIFFIGSGEIFLRVNCALREHVQFRCAYASQRCLETRDWRRSLIGIISISTMASSTTSDCHGVAFALVRCVAEVHC